MPRVCLCGKALLLFFVFLACATCSVAQKTGDEAEERLFPRPEQGLNRVNEKELYETIGKYPFVLVLFDAPSCPSCKRFTTSLQMLASQMYDKEVAMVRVNALSSPSLRQRDGVQSIPLLRLYTEGIAQDFEGEPDVSSIQEFVEQGLQPPFKTVHSKEEFDEVLKAEPFTVVGCLNEDKKYDEIQEIFYVVARQMMRHYGIQFVAIPKEFAPNPEACPNFWFFHDEVVDSDEMIKPFDFAYKDMLLKFKQEAEAAHSDEESISSYIKGGIAREFVMWVRGHSVPLFAEINSDNYAMYLEATLPIVWIVIDDSTNDFATESAARSIRRIANDYFGKLSFVRLNRNLYPEQAKDFDVKSTPVPAMVISDRLKFINPASGPQLTEETIRKFIEDYLGKKLKPRLSSEPEPSADYVKKHAVVKVVGTTWYNIVHDPTKDVFVLYLTDWCPNCKEFQSTWNEVALALRGVKQYLTIASYNWGLNEVENEIKIPGFPALIFYPTGDKDSPITYNGDMTAKDIFEFIVLKRTLSWELPPKLKETVFIEPEEPEDVFFEDDDMKGEDIFFFGEDGGPQAELKLEL